MTAAIADFSEVIIAEWKDAEFVRKLNDRFVSIARGLLGDRHLAVIGKLAPIICSFSYLACTNAINLQTLGEEYVGLVQISNSNRRLPSLWQRIVHIVVDVFSQSDLLSNAFTNSKYFNTLRLLNIYHLEAILFCIGSANYKLGKILARISYLSTRPQQNFFPSSLRILIGLSTLIQFIAVLMFDLVKTREENAQPMSQIKRARECKICSSNSQNVSLKCGHLLCIFCLNDFIENETQTVKCPYCRNKYHFSRTIPLLNF